MKIQFITLFPEVLTPFLSSSLIGKAIQKNLVSFQSIQLRDFAIDKHRTVDDHPYGGGEGMLLKADVLHLAWQYAISQTTPDEKNILPKKKVRTILLSPQGSLLTQSLAQSLVQYDQLILISGHYEGVDQRFIEECVDEEISIGDYVLTGGELPALVLTDALVRLIPGAVGNENSIKNDSLQNGLLKFPQYTKPKKFLDREVPSLLLSGDHKKIANWRFKQSEQVTQEKRKDLWQTYLNQKENKDS